MPVSISRSTFLKGLAGCAVAAFSGKLLWDWKKSSDKIPVRVLGPSRSVGHMIRDGHSSLGSSDADEIEVGTVIIGGGIAGLSAAWWLEKNGYSDFCVLELEKKVGGNSQSGKNKYSAYPWAAHYIPLANEESVYVRQIFQELGVIERFDDKGLPIYNELFLCHDPQERLLKDGAFQEGLVPNRGLQANAREEIRRFFQQMQTFRQSTGADGKPAFAIPLELSSADDRFRALDKVSMTQWLKDNKYRAKQLLWYVNYCCRDDYGATTDNVSAWAGIHYFAGRRGRAANAEQNSVVTWPEGNGFVVNALRSKLQKYIKTGSAVFRIEQNGESVVVHSFDVERKHVSRFRCRSVVFAAPRFVYKYLLAEASRADLVDTGKLTYPPWLVANISLRHFPSSPGVSLAWDNVSYYSQSLGYVVATHQNISTQEGPTVITYYYPLSSYDPAKARQILLQEDAAKWSRMILDDLEKMHPGITNDIITIDLWPWGHGMISPAVGYIWGETRKKMLEGEDRIVFAHSDMSGISNFEEAQYRGVMAAQSVLNLTQ